MRERVTFVRPPGAGIDPGDFQIQQAGLVGPSGRSVREDRLTVALDELPSELASLLRGSRELHLRWTSPLGYDTLEPFSSRTSPGLHVLHAPADDGPAHDDARLKLCSFLQAFGSVDCMAPEAFTSADASARGGRGLSYLYQELEDLSALVSAGARDICPELDPVCQSRLRSLYTAASLDLSFGPTARTLKVAALWPLSEHAITVPASSKRRTEVGVLVEDTPPNLGSHELGVSGLLSVLGEQNAPSPALFAIPSRHRLSDASFSSAFLAPTGLHPTLQLKLSTNQPPAQDSECTAHAFLTLPKTIFADRYQLEDEQLLSSNNLSALRYTSLPVDLEAPAYATKTWGSSILVELAPPASNTSLPWTAQVPLHVRYLRPTASGQAPIEVPYPVVFWACESGSDADLATNPFDRLDVGYDGLFGPETRFWHASPQPETGNRTMSPLSVPVLREAGAAWVGLGTTAVVSLGFAWVVWKLLAAHMGWAGDAREAAACSRGNRGSRGSKDSRGTARRNNR